MSLAKNSPIKSKKLRDSAKGENCTLNIAFVCNYDPSTVVLCHFPSEIAGYKSTDLSAGYGCSSCHSVLDGATKIDPPLSDANKQYYMRRSQTRTLHRLIENGVVKIA